MQVICADIEAVLVLICSYGGLLKELASRPYLVPNIDLVGEQLDELAILPHMEAIKPQVGQQTHQRPDEVHRKWGACAYPYGCGGGLCYALDLR